MKKKIYLLSVIALCFCIVVAVFTSCSAEDDGEKTSLSVTQAAATNKYGEAAGSDNASLSEGKQNASPSDNDGTTHKQVIITFTVPETKTDKSIKHTTASRSEKVTVASKTSEQKTSEARTSAKASQAGASATEKATANNAAKPTAPTPVTGNELGASDKIIVLTRTSPVDRGALATVFVSGKPNTEYTIEFYIDEENKTKSGASGLGTAKSDSNGNVSWDFSVDSGCEPGERKIVIKEKDGTDSVTTFITVK